MIWQDCNGSQHIGPLDGVLFRLVESQEQIATLSYVDTLEEQTLLEQLLEDVKPAYPEHRDDLHYLLKTPFRYPPLQWGSRFGQTHQPSIFYGGSSIETTLAESAYYRFLFWFSMDSVSIKNKIRSEHTLFSARYYTNKGIRLQSAPFDEYLTELADPSHYQACQAIGTAMRAAGVEAFEYRSARDPAGGTCTGLFTPDVFTHPKPLDMSQWLGEVSADKVAFKRLDSKEIISFDLDIFEVDGRLPLPA